jgi:ligand-binding sensor protein
MYKKYQAGTDLSFSVMVDNERVRVVFDGKTMGCSIYGTRDEKLQKAIESHYWFNDKFFLVEAVDEKKEAAEAKKRAAAKTKKKAAEEKKTHIVTDFEDARDYLAETFGVSRSKLKTKEDILSIAKEKGVELEGLE